MIKKKNINEINYLQKIQSFVLEFIPCCKIQIKKEPSDLFKDKFQFVNFRNNNDKKIKTELTTSKEFVIYLEGSDDNYIFLFCIRRKKYPFTKSEIKFLSLLRYAISDVYIIGNRYRNKRVPILMTDLSFGYFAIAQIMCGNNHQNVGSVITSLRLLQQLTFQRYENKDCTSGFVCISNRKTFLDAFKNDKNNQYKCILFKKDLKIQDGFFNSPASYRYVDGKNNFYLLEKQENVFGILSIDDSKTYDIIDRCNGNHIKNIILKTECKWISYLGRNHDIMLYVKGYPLIKWEKNTWHLRDLDLIVNLFRDNKICPEFSLFLANLLITLSELRMGSLILIQENENSIPTIKGKIDESLLGIELYKSINEKSYKELIKSNRIIGVLSSDGITIFNKNGVIKYCGGIIDLSSKINGHIPGGGRTQAALIASEYGMAIKVSEDGPISIFKSGDLLIEF